MTEIYKKMSNVYGKIESIGKSQVNKEQKYLFRGIDDVYNALHKIFAEEGIFLTPEKLSSESTEIISKSGTKGYRTVSTIKFTFYASDGSSVFAIVDGEAMDYGDKSTSKSQSMAIKYALLQTFMIPTEDTEDADRNTPESRSSSHPAEKKKGDLQGALKAIQGAKNPAELEKYISLVQSREWTDEEDIQLSDLIDGKKKEMA